jgi:hypothetical protein
MKKTGKAMTADEIGEFIERETLIEIKKQLPELRSSDKFIPYFQMHEFEALLFSDPKILSEKLRVKQNRIDDIVNKFSTPEDINDNPNTAPSKRLEKLCVTYSQNKTGYMEIIKGIEVAEVLGIELISEECVHFRKWFERIINLSKNE